MDGYPCLSITDTTSCKDRVFDVRTGGLVLQATGGVCLPTPLPANTVLQKQTVDALFAFSHTLAYNYTGQWKSACRGPTLAEPCATAQDRQFVIAITAIAPEGLSCSPSIQGCPRNSLDVPSIGCAACINAEQFVVTLRKSADIRNVPAASVPRTIDSPALEGSFGSSVVEIDWVIADDPQSRYDWYNPGDTLTIVFSDATNMAGLPATGVSKAQIDAIFAFSEPIGSDYIGRWQCGRSSASLCEPLESFADPAAPPGAPALKFSRRALEITILDIAGVAGLGNCADQINGCYDASIDLTEFSIALRAGGAFVGEEWASPSVGGGPGLRNFPAQGAPSLARKVGVDGQFGRSLVVFGVTPSRLPAVGGYITITGKGFGRDPASVKVLIGGEAAQGLRLPTGWTFPVPDVAAQASPSLLPLMPVRCIAGSA